MELGGERWLVGTYALLNYKLLCENRSDGDRVGPIFISISHKNWYRLMPYACYLLNEEAETATCSQTINRATAISGRTADLVDPEGSCELRWL